MSASHSGWCLQRRIFLPFKSSCPSPCGGRIDSAGRVGNAGLPFVEIGCLWDEFTAIIECDDEWFIGYAAEVPGANGQGRTKAECLDSLRDAIDLILEDRRKDALRGVPADAEQEILVVA